MPGRGPAPKAHRRNPSDVPIRGEWQSVPGVGWQHGPIPAPPSRLLAVSERAWDTWMRSWFAAHWTPDDLPGLALMVEYFDQVKRAIADPFIESEGPKGGTVYVRRPSPMTETRQLMDSYGVTLKGQQDRRWQRPAEDALPAAKPVPSPYAKLRSVG